MSQSLETPVTIPGTNHVVEVPVAGAPYRALVGRGLLDGCGEAVGQALDDPSRLMVVTDSHVGPLYGERTLEALTPASRHRFLHTIPAGEATKTMDTLTGVLEAMAEAELDRDSAVVALGGGVVGDMAGFAAACYMRGIKVVQIPTSLLAMVDSSVGGKTAVDLSRGKNLAGAFLQPSLVVADVELLHTIEPDLFLDSCGEVVKHGVLSGASLFDAISSRPLTGPDADDGWVAEVVAANIAFKRDVVVVDEKERGLRQTLNLGHTVGHAIEAASGYSLGHGSCVAAGLCITARAAQRRGWSAPGLAGTIEGCCRAYGLPVGTDLPLEALTAEVHSDKKRHGATINAIIPRDLGDVVVETMDLEGFSAFMAEGLAPLDGEGR